MVICLSLSDLISLGMIPSRSIHVVANGKISWDFPGGPVVKTSPSNAGGAGSIPGWGAKVPHALGPKN